MSEIKPRWDKVNKGVILGMESVLAKQHVMVMQAKATVEGLRNMLADMQKGENEEEKVFEARCQRMEDTISQTVVDLRLKEEVLKGITAEYEEFLASDGPALDTSILEGCDDHKGSAGCCC